MSPPSPLIPIPQENGVRPVRPRFFPRRFFRLPLTSKFPVRDFHCLSRVLAARFLPPGEVEERAHALTSCANTTIAHLMYGDEVLGLAIGRPCEEVKQAIAFRESLFRVGTRFYLANVHRNRIVTGFRLAQHLHCWRARRPTRAACASQEALHSQARPCIQRQDTEFPWLTPSRERSAARSCGLFIQLERVRRESVKLCFVRWDFLIDGTFLICRGDPTSFWELSDWPYSSTGASGTPMRAARMRDYPPRISTIGVTR